MDHTPEEIVTKLGELSPDEIARLLYDEDIVGDLWRSTSCPIATYVHRETGTLIRATSRGWKRYGLASSNYHVVPPSVGQFIKNFDRGQYPRLVRD